MFANKNNNKGEKTMTLSAISKNIIASRLYDAGIRDTKKINEYLDNVLIDPATFTDNNSMFDFIVNNYGKLIIE